MTNTVYTKMLYQYMVGAAAYGSIRKTCHLWDAQTHAYSSYNEDPKPMPLGDKLCVFATSVMCSAYLTPIWAVNDLNYIDVYLSGRDPQKFFGTDNKRYYALDYVLK